MIDVGGCEPDGHTVSYAVLMRFIAVLAFERTETWAPKRCSGDQQTAERRSRTTVFSEIVRSFVSHCKGRVG